MCIAALPKLNKLMVLVLKNYFINFCKQVVKRAIYFFLSNNI